MSFNHGEMYSSANSQSTLCRKDRVPLSEHPIFSNNDENNVNQSFKVSTQRSNVSSPVVGDFSSFPETCNVRKSARGKENSIVCIPLSEHSIFSKNDENNVNQSFKVSTQRSNVSNALLGEQLNARGKQNSTVRIPLSEHPFVRSKFDNVKATFDEVVVGSKHSQLSNCRQRLVGDCDDIRKFGFYKSRKTSEDDNPVPINRVKNPVLLNNLPDIDVPPPAVARKSVKRKCNEELQYLNRPLFSDDTLFRESEDDTDYSQIEQSRIVGFDDDVLSDDDNESPIDDDNDSAIDDEDVQFDDSNESKKIPGYVSLGAPSVKCEFCQAYMWKEERTNKNNKRGKPVFSLCCRKGQIKLPKAPPTPSYLWQLYNDPKKGPLFRRCTRMYNSMFSFTSTGGNIDHSINNGGGPYVYRLNGQNHHVFGSLIPNDGETPKFCQLYIYDTENEVQNRMQWMDIDDSDKMNSEIVDGLMKMLDETNELVKEFRVARDRFKDSSYVDLKIILKVCRSESGRENNIGPSNEVAAIMVGGVEDPCVSRDIILQRKIGGLKRITNIHPKLMALQYPLLFPNGEDGFHNEIKYVERAESKGKKRQKCTMMEFYSYKFQVRTNEGMTPRLGGRLFQQYIVDAFSLIEQSRLWWFRTHQTTLRNELYSHICDYLRKGDTDAANIGKSFILPAGFVGSKRYMQQNFQDALAVCRHVGHPDIFLTMTCNSMWDEIMEMMKLIPNGSPVDNPDVVARVFRLKLDQLLDDIKKNSYFGKCIGVMYVVEFQKRGLPHVHMLIWLDSASKKNLIANVDEFVSAEIPDPVVDAVGYAAVKAFMIHGPCGDGFPKSPCMKDHKCTRHFPKKYCARTMFDESGFPLYKRRNTGVTVKVRKAELDNQFVVPYNRGLLVKYQCHINVEICCHARSLKYLFKYCLKGHDRATVEVRGHRKNPSEVKDQCVDEIQAFFDGRYICGSEASYRTFGFQIHHRSISVERLSFHLPGQKNCTFRSNDSLKKVAEREKHKLSKLEAFFQLNDTDRNAREFTYDEIPQKYVWNDGANKWTVRKKGLQIGRLIYCHHSSGEIWYLRLLLSKVRGPTSFESLRTVNGVLYSTFKEACKEIGLLENDDEWHELLTECSKCGFPPQIRQLFVHIIVNCQVSDVNQLWLSHWQVMADDILIMKRRLSGNNYLNLSEEDIQFYALGEIDRLFKSVGKSLKDYPQLPQPPDEYLNTGVNNLIFEETNYNKNEMESEFIELLSNCNEEQMEVYNAVLKSVESNEGGFFFVYGSGGCGKTYLWRTLICKLRASGKIVLPVASSGIAATLLPGGRTAHSRFKIPILLDDYSICGIGHNSESAELIRRTSLIIWDEAPMQHRYAFECLDRSLRDLMKVQDPRRFHKPFGGITVLLGGDFRQILPVIPYGSRGEVVSACITRSRLWNLCKVFFLQKNMRLKQAKTDAESKVLSIFAKWVLDVGDGNIPRCDNATSSSNEFDICVPAEFCNVEESNSVEKMIHCIYPNFLEKFKCPKYLSERAILTPTNQTVSELNSVIVEKIPGETTSYFSVDKAEEFGGTDYQLNLAFPTEYLNSISVPGLPAHELKLKEGVVVMLMRNLNQTLGLCNGTRMMITKCLKHCVQCEVITGSFVGTRHFIPRIECCPSDCRLPFKLLRKQMPLQVCYAMTINKSQGQSLQKAGLYLPNSVFTHGQFYVAVSRVTSPEGLKLFIDDETGCSTSNTANVVYKEVFYNVGLP